MAGLSPDGRFLLVGTAFERAVAHTGTYPDDSLILWVPQPDKTHKVIASNASDPDGLIVFPVRGDGTLGPGKFQDGKGGSPFYLAFLNRRPHTFVIGYPVAREHTDKPQLSSRTRQGSWTWFGASRGRLLLNAGRPKL